MSKDKIKCRTYLTTSGPGLMIDKPIHRKIGRREITLSHFHALYIAYALMEHDIQRFDSSH